MRRSEEQKQRDKIIGAKINDLRLGFGWSAQQLASKIGVTQQQCRKYFDGSNRIAASRLPDIAAALHKPISYFFEDVGIEDIPPTQHRRMCIEVSRNFLKIKNPLHQNAINLLVRTLSEN